VHVAPSSPSPQLTLRAAPSPPPFFTRQSPRLPLPLFAFVGAAGQQRVATMADDDYTPPRGVKDLPAEVFIQAYATHLKQNDKVRPSQEALSLGSMHSDRPCIAGFSSSCWSSTTACSGHQLRGVG
jgi:hypothetical protein